VVSIVRSTVRRKSFPLPSPPLSRGSPRRDNSLFSFRAIEYARSRRYLYLYSQPRSETSSFRRTIGGRQLPISRPAEITRGILYSRDYKKRAVSRPSSPATVERGTGDGGRGPGGGGAQEIERSAIRAATSIVSRNEKIISNQRIDAIDASRAFSSVVPR